MNSFFLAERANPQNYVAAQHKDFDVSCWKIRFKTQVSACSGSPSEAMLWTKQVEMVTGTHDTVLDYANLFTITISK